MGIVTGYYSGMTFNAKTRRRWFGALCLFAAVTMLVAGETALGERLDGIVFVVFWLVCFVFATLAMLAGILDARALRREACSAQRALLENALEAIQAEKDARNKAPKNPERPPSTSRRLN